MSGILVPFTGAGVWAAATNGGEDSDRSFEAGAPFFFRIVGLWAWVALGEGPGEQVGCSSVEDCRAATALSGCGKELVAICATPLRLTGLRLVMQNQALAARTTRTINKTRNFFIEKGRNPWL